MKIPLRVVSFLTLVVATGCASPVEPSQLARTGPADSESETELVLSAPVQPARGAVILSRSKDGGRVLFGAGCEDVSPELRLFDGRQRLVRTLARNAHCLPGLSSFSPDGRLAVWGDGSGVIYVRDLVQGKTARVSREGQSGLGLEFSPDSSWFVVASLENEQSAMALDAWPADLSAPVEVARNAYFAPFGPSPSPSVRFSPDGRQLLFLGQLQQGLPLGALLLWSRETGLARVVADGVPVHGYRASADLRRLAVLRGVAATSLGEPLFAFPGTLELIDLETGVVELVEQGIAAEPVAFMAGDSVLLYLSLTEGPQAGVLKAYTRGAGRPSVVDGPVLASWGAQPSIAVSPRGDRVAYLAALEAGDFTASLRVASFPASAGEGKAAAVSTREVAGDVLLSALGWAGNGEALVYLHTPLPAMGAPLGTLAAWLPSSDEHIGVAENVTSLGFKVEPTRDDVLFLDAFNPELAAGNLHAWNVASRRTKALGVGAWLMSIQVSPDGERVGFLSPMGKAAEGRPPLAALHVASLRDARPVRRVAVGATSLAMQSGLGVLYTTEAGLHEAVVW